MNIRSMVAAGVGIALSASVLSGCGEDEGEEVAIDPVTEQQEEIAQANPDDPRINLPGAPEAWMDMTEDLIDDTSQGLWMEFASDSYDFEATQHPTLMRMWVLRDPDPDGNGRTGAVFVTAIMRPHEFVDAETGTHWGDSMETAITAMKTDSEIAEGDIAQDEPITMGDNEGHLVSGYGVDGPNADRNFAYVMLDDGHFFYEFRLAGDPDYFGDYQESFTDYVSSVAFDE